ncbi:MAG: ATP-binding protein [Cytophagales bacterium]|nr:ATP-binding protein [Cytophagales bacterium]MCA6368995.1 ATP-binding protein [Cytophagales bacterium]MCA6371495.1 ATP-binding protein [Cytophagales bacterium]MCA6377818.1 ATP-binding protein [Cytophagales bacterium]MCA6385258.1 ATP-binding protein [Cytophagales bacterium]
MDILSQEIAIIVVGSAFLLFVAVGMIVLFLIYQKRQLKFLLEKKELSNQFQHELLKTRLEAQEETLNHLGSELHDNIGQLLGSAKLMVGVAERSGASSQQFHVLDDTISKAIQELRALSKSLNTEWLEKFNWIDNLRTEANRLMATKEVTVTLLHPSLINLSLDRQLILFRIAQEALQNAVKHGKASHITVQAEQNESALTISIADNGKGFDVNDHSIEGVGVTNIRHRVKLLGGQVSWQSGPAGTHLFINLPL